MMRGLSVSGVAFFIFIVSSVAGGVGGQDCSEFSKQAPENRLVSVKWFASFWSY
jgi:hypothetical protein